MAELLYDYFHPFIYMIFKEKNLANFERIKWYGDELLLDSILKIDVCKYNVNELGTIAYNYIDEMSGYLVVQIDPAWFFTVNVTFEQIDCINCDYISSLNGQFRLVLNEEYKKRIMFIIYGNDNVIFKGHVTYQKPRRMISRF